MLYYKNGVIFMNEINLLINNYPELSLCSDSISALLDILKTSFSTGGKLLLCGNGGSASDCEHISGELLKSFNSTRNLSDKDKMKFKNRLLSDKLQYGLPCISLPSFSSVITAVSNDTSPSLIFAQQVFVLGGKNDVLLALSTSGTSENIVLAAETAKAKDMKVVSITGKKPSPLSEISDAAVCIPFSETYRIQELTVPVYHAVCAMLENEFFP